jgi:hypothetical protein
MLRKTLVAIAAAATIGTTMLIPTDASAGYGGYGNRFYGGYGNHGSRFYGGFKHAHFYGFRNARFYGYGNSYYGNCWRWVPTRWGYYTKAWVC